MQTSTISRRFALTLALAVLPPATTVFADAAELRIGPVRGLTTEWHGAPAVTAVPRGSLVLFAQPLDGAVAVEWSGVTPIPDSAPPLALAPCLDAGPTEIVARRIFADGRVSTARCTLDVVDVLPGDVTVTATLTAPPTCADRAAGRAHGVLAPMPDGTWTTTLGRPLVLHVRAHPPAFTPLLETRVDGRPVGIGGTHTVRFVETGAHEIAAGPRDRAIAFELAAFRDPTGTGGPVRDAADGSTSAMGGGSGGPTQVKGFGTYPQGNTPCCDCATIFADGDDCDNNGVPDRCESDCNIDARDDFVSILQGEVTDYDGNWIPDDCDPDCDGDGIPDAAEIDADGDGIPDDCALPTRVTPMPAGPHLFFADFDGSEHREFELFAGYPTPIAASSNGGAPGGWVVYRAQNDHPEQCFNDPEPCACTEHVGDPRIDLENGRLSYAGSRGNFSAGISIAHALPDLGASWSLETLIFPGAVNRYRGQFSMGNNVVPHSGIPPTFSVSVGDAGFAVNGTSAPIAGGALDPTRAYRIRVVNTPTEATGELVDDATGTVLSTVVGVPSPPIAWIGYHSGSFTTQRKVVDWIVIDGLP